MLLSTVQIVPPVTHKILLVEDGSIRTQESCAATIGFTHVKNLKDNIIGKDDHEDVVDDEPDNLPEYPCIFLGTAAGHN